MNDITLSAGGLVIVTSVLGIMATVVTFLFKLLLTAKDDQITDRDAQIAKQDLRLLEQQGRFDHVITITEESLAAARAAQEREVVRESRARRTASS